MNEAGRVSLFIVVGEESGDALAAPLVRALRETYSVELDLSGVAGPRLMADGMESLFPIDEIAVMGLSAVLGRLPTLIKRINQTAEAAIATNPDAVLIVDSPDFTHRVAKRVRKRAPHIPIIGYVSPSVWAWRPGRAPAMRAYVDHLLALFPFEPAVHQRLGGPPCTYVGHRLVERLDRLRPSSGERVDLERAERPTVLVLPGSRRGELSRLGPVFAEAVRLIEAERHCTYILPAVDRLYDEIFDAVSAWPVKPKVVRGEEAKEAAFRTAHAALAASGTVSLELALARVPMVIAYKLDWFYRNGRKLNKYVKVAKYDSIVLPNIIIGRQPIPEFIDEDATAQRLASEVSKLLSMTAERTDQLEAFDELDRLMTPQGGVAPSVRAAQVVLSVLAGSQTV